jgi:hypothetical protein
MTPVDRSRIQKRDGYALKVAWSLNPDWKILDEE